MGSDEELFAAAARHARLSVRTEVEHTGTDRFDRGLCAGRFRLGNGLTVLLMPDRRAPVFAYQTWFRVGSRDEDPDRTGLAHLFEHLMFKGTRNHPTGELDREMERRGSQTNAATWVDWTHYTEALAARDDNLDVTMELEADRMINLMLDEATLRSELEVVKNERRMAVEDSVTGTLGEHLFALAYGQHPYRWPTIGSMRHLEAASLEDLGAFYRHYYVPNNAVLVIVGDLDPADTLTRVAKRYGPFESQPIPRRQRPVEPPQADARLEILHRPIVTPQLLIGFHTPAQSDPAFAALEMLNDVLVAGDSARLYRRLVSEEEVATDLQGYVAPFADPGLHEIFIAARPETDPAHILELLQSELDALPDTLETREIEKARNSLELGMLHDLRDAEGCAELIGHYEVNYGDFGSAFRAIERFARVDAEALARSARAAFRVTNRTAVIAVPETGKGSS